jgi:hypothetical protein
MDNCSQIDMDSYPVINMGGSGQNLVLTRYTGILTLTNSTSVDNSVGIGLEAGQIVLDSTTFTHGFIHVSGQGKLVDQYGVEIKTGTWNTNVTVINETTSVDNIVDSVWEEAIADHNTSGSMGEALKDAQDSTNVPTAEEVADAVWDETAADHTAAGSTGEQAEDTLKKAKLAAFKL